MGGSAGYTTMLTGLRPLLRPSHLIYRCNHLRPATRVTTPAGTTLDLPPADAAVGPYAKCLLVDGLLYTSTHFGTNAEDVVVKGKIGETVSEGEAKLLARGAGLRLLSTVHHFLDGDISRVEQVVKLTGLVNGADDFEAHGAVINGCSELFVEAFGPERGVGTRVCSGAGSLGCVVTCDAIFKVSS